MVGSSTKVGLNGLWLFLDITKVMSRSLYINLKHSAFIFIASNLTKLPSTHLDKEMRKLRKMISLSNSHSYSYFFLLEITTSGCGVGVGEEVL